MVSEDARYAQEQREQVYRFLSPYMMLNQTLADCEQHLGELGIAHEHVESDKAFFYAAIRQVVEKNGYPDTNQKVDFVLHLAYECVRNGMNDSSYPQNYWPLVACHAALMEILDAQQKKGVVVDAATFNVALFAQGMMNIAWKPTRMKQYEELATKQHILTNEQQATNRILNEANKGLAPLAKKGSKFKSGKPKGSLSPLATAVKNYLTKHHKASAKQVWTSLASKPPKGHTFCDNPQGRYVEYETAGKNTNYRRFQNIVSEQRRELHHST